MSVQLVAVIESNLVNKRTHGVLMEKLNRQAMTRIRFNYLPRHFQVNENTRPGGGYGYTARTGRYQIRKAKTKGHQKPLVWSGKMLISIMSSSRITATQKVGNLYVRNYMPMSPQRRSEVENLAPAERVEITERLQRDYVRLAALPQYQRKRRRKTP